MTLLSMFYKLAPTVATLCIAVTAVAENTLQIDGSQGVSIPSNNNYNTGFGPHASLTYATSNLNYRIGFAYLGEFELDDSEYPDNSDLQIYGTYLQLVKAIDLGAVTLEAGAGVLFSHTDVTFLGENLGDKNDTSPFAEITIVKNINRLFALHGGITYFSDVSGADIVAPKVGVRFSF